LKIEPKEILRFPIFVMEVFGALGYLVLTEAETFILALFALLMGIELGPIWGLATFFGIYSVYRMFGGYTQMVASKINVLAQVIHEATRKENK
jgi:hypothetical protein